MSFGRSAPVLVSGLTLLAVGIAVNASLLVDLAMPPAVYYPVRPIPVLSGPVRPGETFELSVQRCAWNITGSEPIQAEVSRELVSANHEVVILPAVVAAVEPGCTTVVSRLNILPPDLPPGRWSLRGAATARHRSSPYQTEEFTVLRKDAP